jgi:hypothetical protein
VAARDTVGGGGGVVNEDWKGCQATEMRFKEMNQHFME